jgi:Trp operon repressor
MKLSDIELKLTFNDSGKPFVHFLLGFETVQEMEETLQLIKELIEKEMEKRKNED